MPRSLYDFQIGEAFGRYELLMPVARGGMSCVWAGRLRGTRGFQRLVAIKTLAAEGSEVERLAPMLLAEARLAAQIHHPNVAQYLDLGERDGVFYVVMEWVDGESLTAVIKRAAECGGIPLGVSTQIIAQACNGLHAAHELRDAAGETLELVHCDVSPHNLMLSASGGVKLIDFGIASATRGAPLHAKDGIVAGKLAFMAPEQARGQKVDRRSDIFSLGIVLYLLTTGRHPFGFGTPSETLERIKRNSPVIPPCAADPRYPEALEAVVMRALSHDPAERFANAAEMMRALGAAGEPVHELEVGAFLREVCGSSLEERRAQVSRALELAATREAESEQSAAASATQDAVPSLGALVVLREASTSVPAAADVIGAAAPKPRRRWALRAAIALCLASAVCAGAARASLPPNKIQAAFAGVTRLFAARSTKSAQANERAAFTTLSPASLPPAKTETAIAAPGSAAADASAQQPNAASIADEATRASDADKSTPKKKHHRGHAAPRPPSDASEERISEHYGI